MAITACLAFRVCTPFCNVHCLAIKGRNAVMSPARRGRDDILRAHCFLAPLEPRQKRSRRYTSSHANKVETTRVLISFMHFLVAASASRRYSATAGEHADLWTVTSPRARRSKRVVLSFQETSLLCHSLGKGDDPASYLLPPSNTFGKTIFQ